MTCLSRWTSRRWSALACWFFLAACSVVLIDGARAFDRVRVVNVSTPDGEPIDAALWDTLRELFARVGVSLTANTPNRDAAAIDVRLAARHRGMDVIVTSAAHEPVHRRVDAPESDELFRETVAHVVLGVVEPLLEEQRPPSPPAAPPPTTSPPQAAPAAIRVQTDLAAGAVMLARGRFAARASLASGLVFPRAIAPSLAIEGALAPDRQRSDHGISGRLYLASLRLRPAVSPFRTRRFSLVLALPVGADLSWFALADVPPGARTTASGVHVDPVVGAQIGARIALAHGLSLTTSLGLDVAFRPRDFLFRDMQRTVVLAELDLLRPYLTIGLGFTSGRAAEESP